MSQLKVYFEVMDPIAQVPTKSHETDAGWDLYVSKGMYLSSGVVAEVHTGIKVALPEGWYGHIMGRSSTPRRYGLSVFEAVIDQGYRGELFLQVQNISDKVVDIPAGVRLGQLLILPVPAIKWVRVDTLPPSTRSENGFGSSGY